jgi:hypothetical protein
MNCEIISLTRSLREDFLSRRRKSVAASFAVDPEATAARCRADPRRGARRLACSREIICDPH